MEQSVGTSKKVGKKPAVTPEYIAAMRAKRAAEKQAKRDALIAQGIDPDQVDVPADLRFVSRPLLRLGEDAPHGQHGQLVKIMTYNVLAQALIRRSLFPTSGNAVKWFKRSQVLLREFKHYDCDVLLLQEVDHVQYGSFWRDEMKKLGYESVFHRYGEKNHGIAICYRSSWFEVSDRMLISYDDEPTGDIAKRTITRNVGLILALKFKPEILRKFPGTDKTGLIIGTTHLFWHPFGTFERTRQTYIILNKFQEFTDRVRVLQKGTKWFQFFGGDFNSQPFDAPYLSITSKPIQFRSRCKTVIECSTSFQYSKKREGIDDNDEEGGNIEKFGEGQPETPVPASFEPTEEQAALVQSMQQLHNSLPMKAISLYSVGYKHVHPENAGLDNDKGEPEISNWAHAWRGLLDYIFYITSWDGSDSDQIGLDQYEQETGTRIRALLRMPPASEMTEHGQPHEGEYPSDHLCMIAEVELLM